MELTKEEWYPIVYDCLIGYGDKFDTLKILATIKTVKYKKNKKSIPIWQVNYKTTQGDWSTGFGYIEVKISELEKLVRDSKLRRLLNK
jgi:hypothetical protein